MATNFLSVLREAVSNFATGTAFETLTGGRIFYDRAPECAPGTGPDIDAYAVFCFPGIPNDFTFSESNFNGMLQFRIFAKDPETCESVMAACLDAYDSSGAYDVKWLGVGVDYDTYIYPFALYLETIIPPYASATDKFFNWEGMIDFNMRFTKKP